MYSGSRDAAREDLLVLVPELDEDDLDRGRTAQETAESCVRDRLALAVRQHDRQPLRRFRGEVAKAAQRRERVQRRRSSRERGAWRRPLDAERALEGRGEDLLIRAREEVRQHAVGERGQTDGYVRERRTQVDGGRLRAVDALRRVETRLREHRAGDVEHDESLRIRANPLISRPLEHRLRCGEAEQGRRPRRGRRAVRRAHAGWVPRHPGCRGRSPPCDGHARSATSGTTTPIASSAPSGVRIVNDIECRSIPAAGSPAPAPLEPLPPGDGFRPPAPSVS